MIYNKSISGHSMPSHDIDPAKKGHDWCLEFSRYIYGQYWGSWYEKQQGLFRELRTYADGVQDYTKYKSLFLDENHDTVTDASFTVDVDEEGRLVNSDARMAFTHIDFTRMFSPAPSIRNTLLGMFRTQTHDVLVDSIDQNSNSMKEDIKYSLMVKMQFQDLYKKYEQFSGIQQKSPVPKNIEELALFESIGGFRLPYEIGLEQILKFTERQSDLDDIKDRVIDDFIVYGVGAAIDKVDSNGNIVKVEYVDPRELIVPFSNSKKFDDIPYWAVQKYYTIQDLRKETGWSEEYIRSLAEQYNGITSLGNPNISDMTDLLYYERTGTCNYNDLRVVVLETEFKTVNSYYKTKVTRDDGNEFSVEEPYVKGKKPKMIDSKTRKTTKTDHVCYYNASWVIGSDRVFNFGKKYDEAFDFANSKPVASLHFYRMSGRSIIDLLRPMLDQCQMAYLRYQNDIAQAPPANGLAIEVGSLSDLTFGNKKIKPFDTIRIYKQKGIMLYQMRPPTIPGEKVDYNNVKPFQEIKGGIGLAVQDFVMATQMLYDQISAMTGIDRITMNTQSVSSDMPATAIKGAISATKDTLKPIYSGWVSIYQRIALATILRGQSLCTSESSYKNVIGNAKYEAIKVAGKTPPAEFGVTIITRPTEAERAEIRQAAQAATMGGKNGIPALSYSEYLFIIDRLNSGASLKDIRAYIMFKERQREEMDLQAAEKNQAMNAQIMQQQEQMKMQKEMATIEGKTKGEIMIEYWKTYFQALLNEQAGSQKLKEMGLQMGFEAGKFMAGQEAPQGVEQQGMLQEGMPPTSEPPAPEQV
jgi:DNA-binding transcriptional MerR regulator